MSTQHAMHADGAGLRDAHETVEIDRTVAPYRWTCPNGHTNWDATNSHIWCQQCQRQLENGDSKIERAEHWELYDKLEGRTVPYAAVEVVEEE